MLNYRFETFLKVCQTLNYTLAAQELNITQPAVSNHISYLEDKLNVTLFTHQHKKVMMTEAGKLLRARLTFLENYSSETLEQLVSLKNTNIKIGYSVELKEEYTQAFIEKYLQKQTHLQLELEKGDSKTLIQQVTNGTIQAAVIDEKVESNTISNVPIYMDEFIGVAASNSKFLSEKGMLTQGEDIPLIIRQSIFKTLEFKLPSFNQKIFIEDEHLITDLVKSDFAITFTLKSAVEEELADNTLKKFASPLSSAPITLIYTEKTPIIISIIDMISSI